jgi:hypothetical protein
MVIIIIINRGLDNEPLKAVGQIDKDFPSPIIKKTLLLAGSHNNEKNCRE